jgi:polysaccharide deacetylase family protein (PEP-CTERM system associated)
MAERSSQAEGGRVNAPIPRVGLVNALTIDVEDYFQVSALEPHFKRADWDQVPCRVERNVDLLLALLHETDTRCTFFTLGWVAKRYPAMVRRIVEQGHELASHGYGHQRASALSRAELAEDVGSAKQLLEDIGGVPVDGYRAPSFSIGKSNLWAFDVLLEAGYRYTSSIYPVKHDHYGMPDAPRFPWKVREGLTEIPVTTTRLLGRNLPAGGGGYFRLAPYELLLPPFGGRSAAAARARRQRQDTFPALRESASHRAAAAPAAG